MLKIESGSDCEHTDTFLLWQNSLNGDEHVKLGSSFGLSTCEKYSEKTNGSLSVKKNRTVHKIMLNKLIYWPASFRF